MVNMNPQVIGVSSQSPITQIPLLLPPSKTFTHGNGSRVLSSPPLHKKHKHKTKYKHNQIICFNPNNKKATSNNAKSNSTYCINVTESISIQLVVTVQPKVCRYFKANLGILDLVLDFVQDFLIGNVLHLELISAELELSMF